MKDIKNSNNLIDFVLMWVDGSDPEWQKEKSKYKTDGTKANTVNRYRDWDNFQYWFRGIEKYAPWVNRIHIVTCGQVPKFLNTNHPKIHMVNHRDIIDEKYLPTFNSSAIEMNIFKIEGLTEHFVFFNDDFFLTNYLKPEDFFINGVPVDEFAENPLNPSTDVFENNMYNNMVVVSKYYDKPSVKKRLKGKYYNLKYGFNNIRTLLLSPYKHFVGFHNPHVAQPFLKSYFEKIYDLETDLVNSTTSHKFRDKGDVTQYLVRYFQLLDGNFIPRSRKFGKLFSISNDNSALVDAIINHKYKSICTNDDEDTIDFEKAKKEINDAFEKAFPEKSSFEK